ncbi:ventral expressed homeobox [Archocentrus centrarchus]|uniref:ventral expressed homeobox n=1 Tax=Archocentrus centrarchus TaxID=63155 RepID=UPI0011EA25DA|nr:homeobox protein vent1-like [Archocentrus centrarchus]
MANFSVECLAKSYYEEMTPQTKDAALHSKDLGEMEEFTKESRSQYSSTSPNNSCGNSSGSESEVGDDSEGEATQQRRLRTKFTSEQISKLENTFSKQKYLGATQRRKIAEELNLSETQVKTWFQNRRMKLKREVQDRRTEFLTVQTALLSPMLFQHPFLSGQLPGSCGFYPQLQPLHRTALPGPLHQHRSHPVILPPTNFF